jgi:photosystem II stability/assembly factor-like uncharacterized protein
MSTRSFLLAASLLVASAAQAQVTLHHVHGLAYTPDGKRLMIPSHHGLALYENGRWLKAPGPQHDYMGFAATAGALYSSGHPAPGSGLVNPFGLLKSRDGGKTWQKLGLEGEADFHLLATSWQGNRVYVWNAEPNSRLRRPGLHFTPNDGFSWTAVRTSGLEGEPRALAVHPDDAAIVAIATPAAIYLSRDSGESFSAIAASRGQGTAVFFDLDGKHLWYARFDGKARLARRALPAGAATDIRLPQLTDDAVAYIAQNPVARGEYAIATFERDVYLSTDGAQSWRQVAQQGRGK